MGIVLPIAFVLTWGRYLAKAFLIGAVGFGLLGTVLLIVYLIKKR